MDKWFTKREQFEMLLDLVKTLNMGNTSYVEDRVHLAKKQFNELKLIVQELRDDSCSK